jgi:hypothetical protein
MESPFIFLAGYLIAPFIVARVTTYSIKAWRAGERQLALRRAAFACLLLAAMLAPLVGIVTYEMRKYIDPLAVLCCVFLAEKFVDATYNPSNEEIERAMAIIRGERREPLGDDGFKWFHSSRDNDLVTGINNVHLPENVYHIPHIES